MSLETAPVPFRKKNRSMSPKTDKMPKDNSGIGSSSFAAIAGAIIEKRFDINYTNPNAVAAKRVGNTVG